MERTQRWLERCIKQNMDRLNKLPDTVNPGQVLFGINQGGTYDGSSNLAYAASYEICR